MAVAAPVSTQLQMPRLVWQRHAIRLWMLLGVGGLRSAALALRVKVMVADLRVSIRPEWTTCRKHASQQLMLTYAAKSQ